MLLERRQRRTVHGRFLRRLRELCDAAQSEALVPDGEELEGLFRRVDKDSSGEIDKTEFAEFVRLCVEHQPGLDFEQVPQADVEAAFLHIDTDGGGTISLEEFEDFFGMCDFLDHANGYLTTQIL